MDELFFLLGICGGIPIGIMLYIYINDRLAKRDEKHQKAQAYRRLFDVIVDTREEADTVINRLIELIEAYGVVTVGDFYDLVEIAGRHDDDKWGWSDLSKARIFKDRLGFLISLPQPHYICS